MKAAPYCGRPASWTVSAAAKGRCPWRDHARAEIAPASPVACRAGAASRARPTRRDTRSASTPSARRNGRGGPPCGGPRGTGRRGPGASAGPAALYHGRILRPLVRFSMPSDAGRKPPVCLARRRPASRLRGLGTSQRLMPLLLEALAATGSTRPGAGRRGASCRRARRRAGRPAVPAAPATSCATLPTAVALAVMRRISGSFSASRRHARPSGVSSTGMLAQTPPLSQAARPSSRKTRARRVMRRASPRSAAARWNPRAAGKTRGIGGCATRRA